VKTKLILFMILMTFLLTAQTEIYDKWDELSKKNVEQSFSENIQFNSINYTDLQKDKTFSEIIELLRVFNTSLLNSKNQKLAFWVNIYNIAAIKIVLDNGIPTSIKKAGIFLKPVWKNDAVDIGGKVYSLAEIEHEILRKMNQPLIHFGIVCASLSCPDLLLEAYRPETVIAQLEENTRKFLKNETKGMRLNQRQKVVELSAIFKWFKDDFKFGIPQFIQKYSGYDVSEYKIKYLDYNWNLNKDNK
jgi:Protein of unknown function, DUF547